MLTFFSRQLAKPGVLTSPRVLVAAHTNVAVDRILTGLLDTDFTGKESYESGALIYPAAKK